MPAPTWAEGLEAGFNICAAPLKAYRAFTQWSIENLDLADIARIHHGEAVSWPWPNNTAELQIRSALEWVFEALYFDTRAPNNITTLARKIMQKVHTDNYEQAGCRTYYAAMACQAMVGRCLNVARGEEAMRIRFCHIQ